MNHNHEAEPLHKAGEPHMEDITSLHKSSPTLRFSTEGRHKHQRHSGLMHIIEGIDHPASRLWGGMARLIHNRR